MLMEKLRGRGAESRDEAGERPPEELASLCAPPGKRVDGRICASKETWGTQMTQKASLPLSTPITLVVFKATLRCRAPRSRHP